MSKLRQVGIVRVMPGVNGGIFYGAIWERAKELTVCEHAAR
jgi:hypothetical protein